MWKWQNIHSKHFFIARNKKHTTACTYIQNTNYRQTDAEHVIMFSNVKPTWSKKDHTLTVQHSVIQGCYHLIRNSVLGHKLPISTK